MALGELLSKETTFQSLVHRLPSENLTGEAVSGQPFLVPHQAEVIRNVRDSLAEEDCQTVTSDMRHKIMRLGRCAGLFLGARPFGGLTVSAEDGAAELVIDSVGASRRLSITVREDLCVQVAQISLRKVNRSGWMKDVYDLQSNIDWLLKDEMNAFAQRTDTAY